MFEVGVAYFVEEKKLSRLLSCVVVFLITWIIGVFCSLSFGPLSSLKILGNTIFDFFDKLSANWLMTLGSLFIVLFVGWKLSPSDIRDELTNGGQIASNNRLFPVILFFIRFIAPAAIAIIFLSNILL